MSDLADVDFQAISDAVEKYGDSLDGTYVGDKRLWVEFRKEFAQHPNAEKTAAAGRPVFDEVEFIHIERPGDRLNVIDCPVNEFHRVRFKNLYEHWVRTQENKGKHSGTPLEKWPEATRGDVEGLRYLGIHTIEQLCTLDDGVLGKHPGLRQMQAKARQWVDVATKNANASQLRAEKEKSEAEKVALQNQLAEQSKRLAQLEERLLKGK